MTITAATMAEEEGKENVLPHLVPIGAFGLTTKDVNVNLIAIRENVAYVASKFVVLYHKDAERRPNMLISKPDASTTNVISLKASPDHTLIAAVEECQGGLCRINFLDAQTLDPKRRPLSCDDLKGTLWDCAFSHDMHYVVGVTRNTKDDAFPSWIYYWRVEDGKVMCKVGCPYVVRKVLVDGTNSACVITRGHCGKITFWRRSNASFVTVAIDKLHANNKHEFAVPDLAVTDFCSLSDNLTLLATNKNSLVVVDKLKVVKTLHVGHTLLCLAPLQGRGFAAASKAGTIEIYDAQDPSNDVICGKRRSVPVPESEQTEVIALSQLTVTADGQQLVFLFEKDGALRFSIPKQGQPDQLLNPFSRAIPGFHTSSVLSMATAARRALLATASSDHTVRIWDYARLTCVTVHQGTHPPLTLAMHPWGTEMVICYASHSHVYVIANELIEGQRLDSPFGGFQLARYAPTGHMMAGAAANVILVYNTMNYRLIATLKGHQSHVNDFAWSEDGARIVSVSDGAVYTWNVETAEKTEEDTSRAQINRLVVCDAAFKRVVVGDAHVGMRYYVTDRADADDVKEFGIEAQLKALRPVTARARDGQHVKGGYDVNSLRLVNRAGLKLQQSSRHMSLSAQHNCIVSAIEYGVLRAQPFPPNENVAEDKGLHIAEVTCVQVDISGDIVFTSDKSGVVMICALVAKAPAYIDSFLDEKEVGRVVTEPYANVYARALETFAKADPAKDNRALNCCYVPDELLQGLKSEVRYLQEGARHHKQDLDLLQAKLTSEYNRAVDALRQQNEQTQQEMTHSMEQLMARTREEVANILSRSEQQKLQYSEQLAEQQDWIEKRLAREIERTDLAEKDMSKMKAKFGKHLDRLNSLLETTQASHEADVRQRDAGLRQLKEDARTVLDQRRVQSDLELLLEARLNEDDLERANAQMKLEIADRDARHMKLFADFQIQKTHLAKAMADLRRAAQDKDGLARSVQQLQQQVKVLEDQKELLARQQQERDALEASSAAQAAEDQQTMQRLKTYQSLAEHRMHSQEEALGPLQESLKHAERALHDAEDLQGRHLHRFDRLFIDRERLEAGVASARKENQRLRKTALDARARLANFLTQLWRTIHQEPKEHWPTIFGKLYNDHHTGKDKRSWEVYSANLGRSARPSNEKSELDRREEMVDKFAQAAADPAAQSDLILELQNNLLSAERMIKSLQRSTRSAQKSRDASKGLMVNENMDLLKILNDLKRDNKAHRTRVAELEGTIASIRAAELAASYQRPAQGGEGAPSREGSASASPSRPLAARGQMVSVGFSYAAAPRPGTSPAGMTHAEAAATRAGAQADGFVPQGSSDWSRILVREPARPSGLVSPPPSGRSEQVLARRSAEVAQLRAPGLIDNWDAHARPSTAPSPNLSAFSGGAQPHGGSCKGVRRVGNAFGSPGASGVLNMLEQPMLECADARGRDSPGFVAVPSQSARSASKGAASACMGGRAPTWREDGRNGRPMHTLGAGFRARGDCVTAKQQKPAGDWVFSAATGAAVSCRELQEQLVRGIDAEMRKSVETSASLRAPSPTRQARPYGSKPGKLKRLISQHEDGV